MLMNFDTDLDRQILQQARVVTQTSPEPVIVETVEVRPALQTRTQFAVKPESTWIWSDLRDYVVREIEARFGPFVHESKKEYGIFRGFLSRWGAQAPAMARYAFDVCDGRWGGSPVTITRFCKGSDPYFAQPIADRLAEVQQHTVEQPVIGWS